jgi:hypothetical protein
MRERSAQIVQLVRAFEESDAEGVLVSIEARAAATRRALRVTGLGDYRGDLLDATHVRDGEVIARRARLLYDTLDRRLPTLRGLLNVGKLGVSTLPVVVAAAAAAGLATSWFGPTRRVDLLSPALLGILAWNLFAYVRLAVSPLVRHGLERMTGRTARRRLPEALAELFMRGAIWRKLQGHRLFAGHDPVQRRLTARALLRYGALWHRSASALLAARVRCMLHLGALALAAGAVGGIYLRGIALGYRASWEEVWLDAARAQALLDVVLGPAAALLGRSVPPLAPLATDPGPAGPWIQLYALTLLLAVGLPRAALAAIETARCIRHASDVRVDLKDPYYARLLRDWRGATTRVDIVPYGYFPDLALLDSLRRTLREMFGGRADVRSRRPLARGDGPDLLIEPVVAASAWRPPPRLGEWYADREVESCHALVFDLGEAPERELHGAFLAKLCERARSRGHRLLVLGDPSGLERRVGSAEHRRERMKRWADVVGEVGLVLMPIENVTRGEQLETALWPSSSARLAG